MVCSPPSSLHGKKSSLTPDILLNQVTDTAVRHFSKKISFHPKCNAGAGQTPAAPSPAIPTAPGQKTQQFSSHISTTAASGAAQAEGHHWNASVGRGKFGKGKKMPLLPSTLYLTGEENRKKDASCFDSCSQSNVSSKVNILS